MESYLTRYSAKQTQSEMHHFHLKHYFYAVCATHMIETIGSAVNAF